MVVLAIMDSVVVRKSVIESHITAKLVEYLLQSFLRKKVITVKYS